MSTKRRHTSRIFFFLIFILILIFSVALLAIFAHRQLTSPTDPTDDSSTIFVIQKGEGLNSIGKRLYDQNLVHHPLVFKYTTIRLNLHKKIQAGDFRLSKKLTTAQIAEALTKGTLDIWITTLEGWRREEIASKLQQTFAQHDLAFDHQEFLTLTKQDEGYLFPDTYLIPKTASAQQIVSIFKTNFDTKVDPNLISQIQQSNRDLHQIITMASIVEREARGKDRPIVAGILWKRLENDWPLQADATLQYIKGYDRSRDTWWPIPLSTDKDLASPYNTYKNPGLPPGPICNPSLSSIQAATSPVMTEYWYYLNDKTGQMHYSTTLDQHQANINAYLR